MKAGDATLYKNLRAGEVMLIAVVFPISDERFRKNRHDRDSRTCMQEDLDGLLKDSLAFKFKKLLGLSAPILVPLPAAIMITKRFLPIITCNISDRTTKITII